MKFSANWLNEYLKKPLQPQEMAELLNMHAFEVESIEKKGNDSVLDIKVLPNRAHDCFSHSGIAKELSAIAGIQFVAPKIQFKEDKLLKINDFISVEVPAEDLCLRYSMRLVVDVKVGPSPKWMQEKLQVCGLRPINNVVDITNYVMLETGEPLHAFDVDKVGGKKIIVRRASEGEQITTLEGKTYKLNSQNLVIADEKVAVGIAGIKGGQGPEIDEKTKNVVIEAANFEPTNIRRTSKKFNLRTDASSRFENGLDPNLTILALERSAGLMAELAQGKIASDIIDIYSKKVNARKILLPAAKTESLLGIKIKNSEIIEIFKRLSIEAKVTKKGKLEMIEVTIPTSRLDLIIPEDLIEEIGRLYGFDRITARVPSGVIIPAIKNEDLIYEDKIKDIMVGLGYSESYNYSWISETDQELFKIKQAIAIKNPLTVDQKYLRSTLAINLLKNIKENLKHFSNVRLFETGRVFYESGGRYQEMNKISAAICHKTPAKSTGIFFELKGAVEVLFEKLGLPNFWFDDVIQEKPFWLEFVHCAKHAQIKADQELIGWVGEIKPEILASFEIKERVAVFELDFSQLERLASEERIYVPPSRFPSIIRDLAVAVDRTTKIEEVLNVIETAGGPLLQDTDLFDIYEDLDENKKSLAFRLIYQSDERNLTDEEVNKLQEKIIKAIEEEGWGVRK